MISRFYFRIHIYQPLNSFKKVIYTPLLPREMQWGCTGSIKKTKQKKKRNGSGPHADEA
jgi:hypothetical protein